MVPRLELLLALIPALLSATTLGIPIPACNAAAAEHRIELSADQRQDLAGLPICSAGRKYALPPELVAGVYLAERALNRGVLDAFQDQIFSLLLAQKNEAWWRDWAERGMRMAGEQEKARSISNKWSPDVIRTGIVVSIGPAQITPRTAINACRASNATLPTCDEGVRAIIAMLLDRRGSIELAARVLRYEAEMEKALAGRDVSGDIALWAAIYNFGGDYYRTAFAGREPLPVNEFGRWVAERADAIKNMLSCG